MTVQNVFEVRHVTILAVWPTATAQFTSACNSVNNTLQEQLTLTAASNGLSDRLLIVVVSIWPDNDRLLV